MRHFNRATNLILLTVVLAGLQSYLDHITTSDYAHSYISVYFYIEIALLTLTLLTGLRNKLSMTIYLIIFLIETVYFFIKERPYSPGDLLMMVVGLIRIYVYVWLTKTLKKTK